MPIDLQDENTGVRTPILKRRTIGESFLGALVKLPEQRDQLDGDGNPKLKDNGKTRKELVITMVALPGATMAAGIGDAPAEPPAAGDVVRTILRGKAWSQYIDAKNALGQHQVGDIFQLTTTLGQAYDGQGKPTGPELTTQAQCDAVPRQQTLGMYGDITVRRATPAEAEWVAKAEAEYMASSAKQLEPDLDAV